jgi:hypothetical protein
MDQPLKEQQKEIVSSDVQAFCELIARIMVRCLREKDPQAMMLLSFSSNTEKPDAGGNHDAA